MHTRKGSPDIEDSGLEELGMLCTLVPSHHAKEAPYISLPEISAELFAKKK